MTKKKLPSSGQVNAPNTPVWTAPRAECGAPVVTIGLVTHHCDQAPLHGGLHRCSKLERRPLPPFGVDEDIVERFPWNTGPEVER